MGVEASYHDDLASDVAGIWRAQEGHQSYTVLRPPHSAWKEEMGLRVVTPPHEPWTPVGCCEVKTPRGCVKGCKWRYMGSAGTFTHPRARRVIRSQKEEWVIACRGMVYDLLSIIKVLGSC